MSNQPAYETVAAKLDAIEAEMRRIGMWQETLLDPEQYQFRGAFAGDTMTFTQWLQFIFLPNARGQFPASSQVAVKAVREFDTDPADTDQLQSLLSEFDALFG